MHPPCHSCLVNTFLVNSHHGSLSFPLINSGYRTFDGDCWTLLFPISIYIFITSRSGLLATGCYTRTDDVCATFIVYKTYRSHPIPCRHLCNWSWYHLGGVIGLPGSVAPQADSSICPCLYVCVCMLRNVFFNPLCSLIASMLKFMHIVFIFIIF